MNDDLVSRESIAKHIDKVRVSSAEIVVHGTKEKPYFEIKYFDLSDHDTHIGYSSYKLDIVFEFLEKYFEIVESNAEYGCTGHSDDLVEGDMEEKKILDVTCGSKTIWFNKHHPATVYCDIRREEYVGIWKSEKGQSERTCVIEPDVQCDFTNLPFPDDSFFLVVFDPPHLKHVGDNAWMAKKYGKVNPNWKEMLHDGFRECMRVLRPNGVLVFKWSEYDIPATDVWKAIGRKPLFGHHSGKNSKTFWACYMKGVN